MKRLFVVLAFASALAVLGPAPASAKMHLWPHRSKSKAAKAEVPSKTKKPKGKREKREKRSSSGSEPLYSIPKSVGWWHKGPGPAGAGAK